MKNYLKKTRSIVAFALAVLVTFTMTPFQTQAAAAAVTWTGVAKITEANANNGTFPVTILTANLAASADTFKGATNAIFVKGNQYTVTPALPAGVQLVVRKVSNSKVTATLSGTTTVTTALNKNYTIAFTAKAFTKNKVVSGVSKAINFVLKAPYSVAWTVPVALKETPANNGTVMGTVVANLTGAQFAPAMVKGTQFTVTGVPSGVNVKAVRNSATRVTFTFESIAKGITPNAPVIKFTDKAFVGYGSAAKVTASQRALAAIAFTQAGTITGTVKEGAAKLAGVKVELKNAAGATIKTFPATSSNGVYTFTNVAVANGYKVVTSKVGYNNGTSALINVTAVNTNTGKDVVMTKKVVAENLTSITAPTAQNVANGTALATVKTTLTNKVAIATSTGVTKQATIVWEADTTPAYNAATAGTYVLTGKVTLPTGMTNTSAVSLNVSVNIVVAEAAVVENLVSITAPTAQNVANGTALTAVKTTLTDKVAIVTSTGVTKEATIEWATDTTPTYAAGSAGTYALSGTVTLPTGITNTNTVSLNVSVNIVVAEAAAVENLVSITAPVTQNVDNGTTLAAVKTTLTDKVAIVTSTGVTKEAAIVWAADTTPTYAAGSAGTYVLSGTAQLPTTVTNTNNVETKISVSIIVGEVGVSKIDTLGTNITDLVAPEAGTAAPVALTVAAAANYTASAITWTGLTGTNFTGGTANTATITFTAKEGFTFTGTTINAAALGTIFKNGTPVATVVGTPAATLVVSLAYTVADISSNVTVTDVSAIDGETVKITGTNFTTANVADLAAKLTLKNTATPTTTYAISKPVFVSATEATVTTAKIAGTVTSVTWTYTPTTGTPVTGTFAGDAVKPTIVSVQNTNGNQLVVMFSKKVNETNATTIGNYSIQRLSDSKIQAATGSVVVNADKKSVTITLDNTATNAVGIFGLNTLDSTAYRLFVNTSATTAATRVSDLADNAMAVNSLLAFDGHIAADTTPPQLIESSYNKGSGILTLTFNEKIANNLVTFSKIKFNSYVLTTAVTQTVVDNVVTVNIATADVTAITALTAPISVTLAAGAFKDASTNETVEIISETKLTQPPTISSAAYDEATRTLTINFSTPVKLVGTTAAALGKITLKSTEMTGLTLGSGDTVIGEASGSSIAILLSSANAASIAAIATHTSPKITAAQDTFANVSDNTNNLAQTGTTAATLTITKDTLVPVIQSVTYNESTGKIVITFNQPVENTADIVAGVKFYSSATDAEVGSNGLTGIAPSEVLPATTLTYTLPTTDTGLTETTDFKTVQQAEASIYLKVNANTFTKAGSLLKNAAVTAKAPATTVVYTDDIAPSLSTNVITPSNQVTLSVGFSEKLDGTAAGVKENYKVWLMNGATKVTALRVNSVTFDTASKKSTTIITDAQTTGATYLLEVSNVKDIFGNVISSTDIAKYSKTFQGSNVTSPAPNVTSAKIKDNGDNILGAEDYIAVTFDRPVALNATSTNKVADVFTLASGGAWPTGFEKTNISLDPTDEKVVLVKYFAVPSIGASAVTVGTSTVAINSVAQTLIVDKYSQVAANNTGGGQTITSPLGATTITEALLTDVNNSGKVDAGDTLKVTFSNPLKVKAGQTLDVSDVVVTSSTSKSLGNGATIASAITTTVANNSLTVTLGTSGVTLTPALIAAAEVNISASQLVDSWGIEVADTQKSSITTPTTAAPVITKAEFVDVDSSGSATQNDFVYVTFNVPVSKDTPTAKEKWLVNNANLAASLSAVDYVPSDNYTLRLTLGGSEQILSGVSTIDIVAGQMLTNITNFAGASATALPTGTTVKITMSSDITPPTIVKAEFINETQIKVLFNEAVNLAGYVITGTAAGFNLNSTDKEFTRVDLDTTDTTGKTAIFTNEVTNGEAAGITQTMQMNGLLGGATGLAIVTANGIKDLSGNQMAATTSSTLIAIAKDATAPRALTAAEVANISFSNTKTAAKVVATGAVTYPEFSLLQIYFGTAPGANNNIGTQLTYAASLADTNTPITGLTSQVAGTNVYYRYFDRAGNASEWTRGDDALAPAEYYAYALASLQSSITAGKAAGTAGFTVQLTPAFYALANTAGTALMIGTATAVNTTPITVKGTGKNSTKALEVGLVIANDNITVSDVNINITTQSKAAPDAANTKLNAIFVARYNDAGAIISSGTAGVATNVTVDNSNINLKFDPSTNPLTGISIHGFALTTTQENTVKNCTITVENEQATYRAYGVYAGAPNVILTNNTIIGNGTAGTALGLQSVKGIIGSKITGNHMSGTLEAVYLLRYDSGDVAFANNFGTAGSTWYATDSSDYNKTLKAVLSQLEITANAPTTYVRVAYYVSDPTPVIAERYTVVGSSVTTKEYLNLKPDGSVDTPKWKPIA